MYDLKSLFTLDEETVFLNHGSFGATPRPVMEAYQEWQQRLERQPVRFLVDELPEHLAQARRRLGSYLNADGDDLAYIPNATFGLNVVARSLELGVEDEVLSTNHEYGACDNVWGNLSRKQGFRYVQQPISLPVTSQDEIVDQIWDAVTPRTRVIYLSHIASPTATRFPVETLCHRAEREGILTVIDGAHAPGQIPLDMARIGADFYFGNAHKWMCSPKGAAFLYARNDRQPLIEPLVVGWGWGEERTFTYGSDFLDSLQWLGTNDPSGYLAVPAAIDFQEAHDWPDVREQCHELLREALYEVTELTGIASCYPDDSCYHQMAIAPLPPIDDLAALKSRLLEMFQVEIPFIQWHDHQFIRISVQGYNERADIERLLTGLEALLPEARRAGIQ